MTRRAHARTVAAALGSWLGLALAGRVHTEPITNDEKGNPMTQHVHGAFDVTLTPQPADGDADESGIARMLIDKQYHGALEAHARGHMLTATTAVDGSAGYVAIERVTGTLAGRTGSFMLQHSGLMARGAPTLTISVVPDSGTGELTGISGSLAIGCAGSSHTYDFEFTLPETR